MTVFVAGVHGVGKSYLCQQYADTFFVIHESASGLIRKERAHADWSTDKKVANIDENQVALRNGVQRIISVGKPLLLDGHFVLIDKESEFVPIDMAVFGGLNLSGVVLLEARPELIASRLATRDAAISAVDIEMFLQAERVHARLVCEELGLPLKILREPDFSEFSKTVEDLFAQSKAC